MKNILGNIQENYKLVLGVLIAGLFLGWLLFHPSKAERANENQIEKKLNEVSPLFIRGC